jgi:hypothetical protein
MLWVREESTFRELFAEAQRLVFIDDGGESTTLKRLHFDDAELLTPAFLSLLKVLMELSGDSQVYYLVLSPDPVLYFSYFHRHPLLEIAREDTLQDYLGFLNEDPGGSPADAIGIAWSTCTIFPRGHGWFMCLLRSAKDDGGHLWIPREWVDRVTENYPYLTS